MCSVCMYVCMYVYIKFLTFVFKINGCYRHELWKDYENSKYTGNRNFTQTRNENFGNKLKKITNSNKNLLNCADFLGWSADGKQTIF